MMDGEEEDDGSLRTQSNRENGDALQRRPQRTRRKKAVPQQFKMVYRYKQKYISKWERIPEYQAWLTQNSKTGSAHCLYCNVDINIEKGKTQLSRHCQRMKHRKNERLWHRTPLRSCAPATAMAKSAGKFLGQQVQRTESQLVAFLVENNLSLSLADPLVAMLKRLPSIGDPVRRMRLPREKAFSIITRGFSWYFKQDVAEKLKDVLFSIVLDVAYDRDDRKHLVLCVSYCDDNLQMQVDVLDTFDFNENQVESIFADLQASLTELEEAGVPPKNWVGFLIDTTNALFVTSHSLAILISQWYPWVIPIRSPCHMAHLAASSACEKLPPKLENFCRSLHAHFRASPNQPAPFLELQELCRLDKDEVFAPGQDQWLSVQKFIKLIIEIWEPLESHFTELVAPGVNCDDDGIILEILADPLTKVSLQFVEHVLSVISAYNKTFQVDDPLFFQLQKETTELIRKLALSFMRRDAVRAIPDMMEFSPLSGTDFLPLPQLYIGLEASATLAMAMTHFHHSYESREVSNVLETCQSFYKEIIVQIQSRFDFSHPVFHLAGVIDPRNAISLEPASLAEFFANYDHPDWDKNKIEAEWRAVSNLRPDEEVLASPLRFWRHVLSRKSPGGRRKFGNLRRVVLFFLSLPFSSVVVAKVARYLKRTDIGGRLNLPHSAITEYARLHGDPSAGADGSSCHQRRRRKVAKKDAATHQQI